MEKKKHVEIEEPREKALELWRATRLKKHMGENVKRTTAKERRREKE